MKKFLIFAGIILFLVVGYIGLEIWVDLFYEPPCILSKAQCEALVLGVWEDPLGDYANYEFRADGTGMLGDIPIRWEVKDWSDAGDHNDYDASFRVYGTSMGQEGHYSIRFYYYAETNHARAHSYGIYNDKNTVSLGDEKVTDFAAVVTADMIGEDGLMLKKGKKGFRRLILK